MQNVIKRSKQNCCELCESQCIVIKNVIFNYFYIKIVINILISFFIRVIFFAFLNYSVQIIEHLKVISSHFVCKFCNDYISTLIYLPDSELPSNFPVQTTDQ